MLAATLVAGLALSLASAALAAPVGTLKQFKVPTANSQPRGITNGSDGNRWFTEGTEGTEFTNAPPRIARITPSGAVTEIPVLCNSYILTDIIQGPDNVRRGPLCARRYTPGVWTRTVRTVNRAHTRLDARRTDRPCGLGRTRPVEVPLRARS